MKSHLEQIKKLIESLDNQGGELDQAQTMQAMNLMLAVLIQNADEITVGVEALDDANKVLDKALAQNGKLVDDKRQLIERNNALTALACGLLHGVTANA